MWFSSILCALAVLYVAVSLWGKMYRQISVLSVFSASLYLSTMIQVMYTIDYSY